MKISNTKVLGALMLAVSAASMTLPASAAPLRTITPVWESNASGNSFIYRAPAVASFPDGRVVALCVDMDDDYSDLNPGGLFGIGKTNLHLKAKVGYQNGNNWTAEVAIPFDDQSTDASIVYDAKNQQMVVLFTSGSSYNVTNGTEEYWMTTSPDGLTWATPVKISSQIKNATGNFNTGFTSSGSLMQDKDGAIYTVVNGGTKRAPLTPKNANEYVYKSTDGGANWTLLNQNGVGDNNGNEAKVVQLGDGSLLMSMRGYTHKLYHSTDGGATWSDYAYTGLEDCDSNSDIIRINYNGQDYLVMAIATERITSTDDTDNQRGRVKAFYSTDNGRTWQSKMLFGGLAGYASLTDLGNGVIGCLLEVGGNSNNSPKSDQRGGMSIQFVKFNMEWLLDKENAYETFDGSLDCDGMRYVSIPKHDAFSVAAGGKMTVTANIYVRSFGQPRGIIATRHHSGTSDKDRSGFELFGAWDTNRCFSNNVCVDGNKTYAHTYGATANAIDAGTWYHIAWVFDNSANTSKLYINGELKQTVSGTSNTAMTLQDVVLIGNRFENDSKGYCQVSSTRIWDGKIDDVRFYSEALSAADVAADQASGFPIRNGNNGLIAAYDFEDYTVVDGKRYVSDISGNGHTGELYEVDSKFPQAPKNVVMTVETPESGAMTVKYFPKESGSAVPATGNPATHNLSYAGDYFVELSGWDMTKYELEGVYCAGHLIPNTSGSDNVWSGFFKATNPNSNVYARFRWKEEVPANFYLVVTDSGDDFVNGGTMNSSYLAIHEFKQIDKGVYELVLKGDFDSKFYIDTERTFVDGANLNGSSRAANSAELKTKLYPIVNEHPEYSYFIDDAKTRKVIHSVTDQEYKLENSYMQPHENNAVHFTTLHATDGRKAIANPVFTLTYKPDAKTLSIAGNGDVTGIEDIESDIDFNAPVEYYNLQGMQVAKENLTPGVYIVKQGDKAVKMFIK